MFGLSCFAPGEMGGSELSDADFYREARLHGGLAYTPESLRWIFSELTEVELRRMHDEPPESPCFGEPFLWTALFRRTPLTRIEQASSLEYVEEQRGRWWNRLYGRMA
jgi:hypothetical protein